MSGGGSCTARLGGYEKLVNVTGRRLFLSAAVCALLACSNSAAYAAPCADPVARAVSVQGTVEARPAGSESTAADAWSRVKMNDSFCPGDAVRTSPDSRADLLLGDQSVLRVAENTTVVVQGVTSQRSYIIDLLQGAGHFFSRTGETNLEVKTPYTVAGVRGTEFSVDVGSDAAVVRVFEGTVLASNDSGSAMLASGQSAVAERGKAPLVKIEARPRDAVRWALYYDPVLYQAPGEVRGSQPWQKALAQSQQAYRDGDTQRAFAALQSVPDEAVTDPRFFTYRASLRLAVGQVTAAEADVAHVLASEPTDPEAIALRTVIALANNENDAAMQAATTAVSANPDSATALIALSYAQQAAFNLEAARTSLQMAVRLQPDNALAWTRLAELQSAFGDTKASLESARRAERLEPNLSRTHTVLGFAHLTRVNTEEAKDAFTRAIDTDPADPLPRLGLGLAKIREGHLDEGSRDLEIAASLDPNNALVRSYLGKVYYEQKHTKLDEREYDTAKKLDPNDPTPWFYDAIAKQTTNRPVEALRNLDRSIELNDNRAVYRSRLLLDSDLAARSASLARIYGDLGFRELALVEGWKSVSYDPTNYSAHRLLADSYSVLPRHEIARVSELLQAQMLQPINITPLQPRAAESNLFLLSTQGPSTASMNEFQPLFNRNQVAVQGTALVGEDDTHAGDAIVSGIYDKASFSTGYSGYRTDGFRDNNDQNDDVANAFAQVEITPSTSLQGEYRYRDLQNGDLELRFLKDDFSRFLDETTQTNVGRVGLRHAFSPNSIFLASYIHQDMEVNFRDFVPDPIFGDFSIGLDVHNQGDSGEVQQLYRATELHAAHGWLQRFDLSLGSGYSVVNASEQSSAALDPFPPDVVTTHPDVRHGNVYAYSYWGLRGDVTLTLGGSGDFFREDQGVGERNHGNPKVGLLWNPAFLRGTTFRAAAFRTLTRTLTTSQTLEPTQVAGFNQFYDDPPGTESWIYGGAVDQKFTSSVFGGVEVSKRDLHVPQTIFGGTNFIVQDTNWDELVGRAYAFWTPHDWVAARIEYAYEDFKRDPKALFAFERVETHRVPLGLEFFHPSGVSASLGATYLSQDGRFLRNSDATFQSGDRNFWVLDTGIRYRLPKRYGFVSFGVNNFLDEKSTYQATDVRNPDIRPGRFIFGAVTLALP